MHDDGVGSVPETLEAFVEAYESAQSDTGTANVADFLPAADHPLHGPVLRELVRVELEYSWSQGSPRSLEGYGQRFPELLQDPASLEAVAFEEYRLRCQAGESPSPQEYQQRFGVYTSHWPAVRECAAGPSQPHAEEVPPDRVTQVAQAYQEFRQRFAATNPDDLKSWLSARAASADEVQLFCDVHQSDPSLADRLAEAMTSLPVPGSSFLGFHLIAELGRGAFARVYLARQGDLADRLVAVKVAADIWTEPQTLAQLQHTNIIPIYSLHRAGALQAVCMPFLGATTLADVLQELQNRPALPETALELGSTLLNRQAHRNQEALRSAVAARAADWPAAKLTLTAAPDEPARLRQLTHGRTYGEAVLWLAARLAEGLAHAHDHGIFHRDLKPANILLADDGEPVLLDFNLSEDTKLRGVLTAALIGGTLAYMAPEHLEAFHSGRRSVDGRSDLYSLGIILFELLTGRHPFPGAPGETAGVPQLIAQRRQPPPRLRGWNPAVSPAVESIIRHCLEPEAARRYQSARDLEEDLKRHLDHRPLRFAPEPSLRERIAKWLRRHPRLTSASSVALVSGCALLLLGVLLVARNQRLNGLEAVAALNRFDEERKTAQFLLINHRTDDISKLDEATAHCRRLLEPYQLFDNPSWQDLPSVRLLSREDRHRLGQDLGELLLLWARVTILQAARCEQPADRDARLRFALRLNQLAETCFSADSAPAALWQQRVELLGPKEDVQRLLDQAAAAAPTARNLVSRAGEHLFRNQFREAGALLQQARRHDPQDLWIWFDLGICHENLAEDAEAAACYSTCIALSPRFAPFYYKRGLTSLRQKHYRDAVTDFDAAIRLQPDLAAAYHDRALARLGANQPGEAIQDLTQALERGMAPTRILLLRAQAHAAIGNREAADADRRDGLRRQPADEIGFVVRGLAQLPRDPKAALADFDEALKRNPTSLTALQNKAHVLAERLGRTEDAIQVLDTANQHHPDSVQVLGGRGVLRGRLGQRAAALRDAESCLVRSADPALLYQVACIYALTSRQAGADSREALRLLARALGKGYGWDLVDRDSDLEPIRSMVSFQDLLRGLRAVGQLPGR